MMIAISRSSYSKYQVGGQHGAPRDKGQELDGRSESERGRGAPFITWPHSCVAIRLYVIPSIRGAEQSTSAAATFNMHEMNVNGLGRVTAYCTPLSIEID